MRAFVDKGDRDRFDFALRWINNRQANAEQWKASPRDAALFDAGVLDVFLAAAGPDPLRQALGSVPAADLAMHVDQIPADALPLDLAPLRALHMTRPNGIAVLPFAHDLVQSLRNRVPTPPLAAPPKLGTPAGDAALGVAVATSAELIETWPWGLQSDAQAFALDLAGRLDVATPAAHSAAQTFRTKVQAGPSFDAAGADAALGSVVAAFTAAGAPDRGVRVTLGSAAAQLADNAMIAREEKASHNFLTVLANADSLDAVIPGWSTARTLGTGIGSTDWLKQHAYALELVDLIEKANNS